MKEFLPYIALVTALVGAGVSWGVNDTKIKTLETDQKAMEKAQTEYRESQIRIEERQKTLTELILEQKSLLQTIKRQTQ